MKYIINEHQYRLLRRESEIRDRIDNQLMIAKLQNDLYYISLEDLILNISNKVAIEMADESNLEGDDYIIFRNQIKQYIRGGFYPYIKEYWELNK
jgi:hypothetical protein